MCSSDLQGYHNYNNTIYRKVKDYFEQKSLKDPQLTETGIKQAQKCGVFLNDFFKIHNIDKTKFTLYCSILLRTRETINNILDEISIFDDIYILPCSHEINSIVIPEIPISKTGRCTSNPADRILYQCDYVFSKDHKPRNIIWDYYKEFKNNNVCKNTNMIYESYIIYAKLKITDKEYGEQYVDELKKKLKIY